MQLHEVTALIDYAHADYVTARAEVDAELTGAEDRAEKASQRLLALIDEHWPALSTAFVMLELRTVLR